MGVVMLNTGLMLAVTEGYDILAPAMDGADLIEVNVAGASGPTTVKASMITAVSEAADGLRPYYVPPVMPDDEGNPNIPTAG